MNNRCKLTDHEKRIYCAKKRVSKSCLEPWFIKRRCPYLEWNKQDVMKEARKGINEIISKSGFSNDAIKYAEAYRPNLKLIHGDLIIKPERIYA